MIFKKHKNLIKDHIQYFLTHFKQVTVTINDNAYLTSIQVKRKNFY